MTDQQLVAVMLPREDVEGIAGRGFNETHPDAEDIERFDLIGDACRQALANPSVTVEGRIEKAHRGDFNWFTTGTEPLLEDAFANSPEGPCLVTVTSIKEKSDE